MAATRKPPGSGKHPVSLTVHEDILKAGKELKINTSQAAEAGIILALKSAHKQK